MPVATSAYAGEINEIQWQTCGKYKIYYVHRSSSTHAAGLKSEGPILDLCMISDS